MLYILYQKNVWIVLCKKNAGKMTWLVIFPRVFSVLKGLDDLLAKPFWFDNDGRTAISIDPVREFTESVYDVFVVKKAIFFIKISICSTFKIPPDFFPYTPFLVEFNFYRFWSVVKKISPYIRSYFA